MERIPIHVNERYEGTFVCPRCGTARRVNLQRHYPRLLAQRGEKRATSACRCGTLIAVTFDCRRHRRKAVRLQGTLHDRYLQTTLSDVLIVSVSVDGVGFVLPPPLPLAVGGLYRVCFRLDDVPQTLIQEGLLIRRCDGQNIGADFYPRDRYQYALDFYVYGAGLLPPPRRDIDPL